MMRWFTTSVLVLCFAGEAFSAPLQRFPYEAAVEGKEAFARSGPGRNYYPTAKLQHGVRVVVHRHDPGGWYMIAPPPGSFSWIRASYVKQQSPGRGVLTSNDVIVRVGSGFGDDRDVEQVRLSTGDAVAILGEQNFSTRAGAVKMFKISPPRGEYRWVPGRFLTPLDASARRANDRDPYAVPSHAVRETKTLPKELGHPIAGGGPQLGSPHGHAHTHEGPSHSATNPTGSPDADREKLAALDQQFRTMCRQNAGSWDFTHLEAEYRHLRKSASQPYIARQIDRRLPTIDHYRSVKAEFDKLIQLTAETQRRDAELAGLSTTHAVAMQSQPGPSESHSHSNGPVLAAPQPAILPAPGPSQPPTTLSPPVPTPATQDAPSFQPPLGQPAQQLLSAQRPPRFDGAGIVKRVKQVRPGLPHYAIVSPDGRFLAYLQPARGLSLEQHVGRAMGVYGKRQHRRDLGGDFIVVNAMQPVRLRP